MANKKIILNSDGFGISKAHNRAVLNGYHNGFLTSASLCPNGKAFYAAVNEIIPECPNLSIGIHLNITKGRSLTKSPLLTNKRGKFNKSFLQILLNSNNEEFLKQVEFEFRTQIETVMNYTKIDHINSLNHIHSIPNIFKITSKLAKEYNIPFVRNSYEEIYFVPSIRKYLNFKYPANLLKTFLLNTFSRANKSIDIHLNEFLIGVEYSCLMDKKTIEYGLKAIESDNCIVEIAINPCQYSTSNRDYHYNEFLITQNKELKDKITRLGFEITNYKKEYINK